MLIKIQFSNFKCLTIYYNHFKNVIVTSKVIEKSSKDGKGILLEQSRAIQWKYQRDKKQWSKAQLQDQVTFFIIYFNLLIQTNFNLDQKNRELLNASLLKKTKNQQNNTKHNKKGCRVRQSSIKCHLFK